MQPPDHVPPRATGPNLLHGLMGKPAAAPAGHHRILARLEHGEETPPPSSLRRGRIAASAAVMLVLAGALAWTFYQNIGTQVLDLRGLSPGMVHPDGVAAGAGQRPRPASAPAASADPQPQPMSAQAQAQAPRAAPSEQMAAAIVDEPQPGRVKTPAAAGLPAMAVAPAAAHAPTPAAPPTAKITASPTANAAIPPTTKGKTPPAAVDSDVALLTALVAHANNQTVPAPPDKPYAVSRDVVSGLPGDTTESLLRRCTQLGLIEAMLCHARICSGRAEDEPACR